MRKPMHIQRVPRSPARQKGSSLLEVLIAVLVMAIGMLGIAALQAITLKNSNSSAGRSQAVIHIYSAYDTLRLDRANALAGRYDVPGFVCAAQTAAEGDTNDYSVFNGWLAGLQGAMGGDACGRIDCDQSTSSCVVGVQWNDSRAAGGSAEEKFEINSRL
ncbi:prepilin-type N-terminal cleavage/methylation domain-containing protein [Lysobacter sp. LF1]|uniref:Prepilin-type N-terminal cleavage/methylation domain-containing protein n=1 Tax=Lysobacter stagni TaxID=3045172 RepID=A0ABT6XKV1_9GAMM|nr:prepilin-type N-terminal cleavage/methylation domain-containing protein [Lysobacter sp. LF1]MDI9240789.1 prepilin-type N-terminal cleavage/methylation domain-containing protein [Lysobacter sp. LF1]